MTASSFNVAFTIYLSIIFHQNNGFEVIQPHNRTVNPDGVVSISCEFNAEDNSVVDVRLNRISPTDNKKTLLCQKGMDDCPKQVIMHEENPRKWLFILLNIGPDNMSMTYECEFTVNDKGDLHHQKIGTPTKLLQGQQETKKDCVPPSSLPTTTQGYQLGWILIGPLALLFLCNCVIICLYIKLRKRKEEYENGTYVEMRKAPMLRNPVGIFHVN